MSDEKKRIYIADDEKNIRELIVGFLKNDGFDVVAFATGDALYEAFRKEQADLLILDIMMPGTSGLEICRKIREKSDVPIIILTAKDSELDYVQGISLGSDDYLTKPFRPMVLLMRVRALLRRVEMDNRRKDTAEERPRITTGDLIFSPDTNTVLCAGKELSLTQTELHMLTFMMKTPGKACSREELLKKIWGFDMEVETRVTDETMRRIRRKLSQAGSNVSVQTVWGYGYKLIVEEK